MNKSIAELTQRMEATNNLVVKSVIKDIIYQRTLKMEELLSLAWEALQEAGYEDYSFKLREEMEKLNE